MITETRTYFENGSFVDLDELYQPVRKAVRFEGLAWKLFERAWHGSFAEQNFRNLMADRAGERTSAAYTEYLRATHGVTIATVTRETPTSEGYGRFEVIDNSWAFTN